VEVEGKDLTSTGGGGAYASLEPGDYEAVLTDVEDYDYRARGASWGWLWLFTVEGLPFKVFTSFSPASRWKLVEVVRAFAPETLAEGVNEVDPNAFIGLSCGAHVDFRTPPEEADPTQPNYKEIKYVFVLPPESRPEEPPTI
jgi:hypothetical protein